MPDKEISLQWTPFALNCLNDLYDYIVFREKSASPANKFINAIFDKAEQLKSFPESGQPEPLLKAIGQDSRYLVVAHYKIIYEYHPVHSMVIITDVFHTSQDPGKVKRSSK